MAEYTTAISWKRNGAVFTDKRYSRLHRWKFDGGIDIPGSSSPRVVPIPVSEAPAIDPEEAFVAALASCHMLWFLSIAAERGFVVENYADTARGIMAKNSEGKLAMTVVTLCPDVLFEGDRRPTREEIEQMHHRAHDECFIASSVKTEVRCKPIFV
jgi:organic hydroperoxide reductase OsmC/OhrA